MFALTESYDQRYEIELYDAYISILSAQVSFHEFVRQAWVHVEGPHKPFIDNWHIGAMCEHLQATVEGELKNLIVMMPPRCMKSTILSVCFCPWVWINYPHKTFYYASYDLRLSFRDSLRARRLIESDWYQLRWGKLFNFRDDENNVNKYSNDKFGHRACTSTSPKSGSTGHGGDFRIIDDPNRVSTKRNQADSDASRDSVNEWYSAAWSTRYNNPKKDVSILCAQRTHESDLIGFVLSLEDESNKKFTCLKLPMEFEKNGLTKTILLPSTNGTIWQDPRTEEGELLFPDFMGQKELKDLKTSLGNEYRIAGQLQQRPAPADGGIIKKKFFKLWKKDKMPNVLQIIQSWDCALDDKKSCSYSACTTWGLFIDESGENALILLNAWRGRVNFDELRKLAKKFYEDYMDDGIQNIKTNPNINKRRKSDYALIEAKATGPALISSLTRAGIKVIGFDPGPFGDKTNRVQLCTPILESGLVYVAAKPPDYTSLLPYAAQFVELCAQFPNSQSKDVVDTMSQVLLKLDFGFKLIVPEDRKIAKPRKYKNEVPHYGPDVKK